MSTLAELRSVVAGAIQGVGGLTAYDYPPGSVPVLPAAVVEPEEVDFRSIKRGSETWTLSVFILVAPADDESAARLTDAFFDRSGNDLKDAIEGADTDASLEVTGADRWGEYPMRDQTLAGLRFVVEVFN